MSGTIILGQHRKFNMTSRVYGLDGIAPTLWSNMMKDPPRVLIDKQQMERRCVQVATLDKVAYPQIEQHRRVYSIDAASPTIPTHSGGGNVPLILEGD